MRFSCPTCNQLIQVADDTAGQTIACPTCRQRLKVPGTAPVPRAAPVDKTLLGQIQEPARTAPAPAPAAEPPPEPRRSRARDDWDDDYDRRPRRRPYDDYDGLRRPGPEAPIGMAVASLVCGIIGAVTFFCVFTGPICSLLGIIFGCIHLSNKTQEGRGLAIGGLSAGGAGIGLFVVFLLIVIASNGRMFWFR
jgi:hypothetical protein